ncbi:MAG: hypothetical protein KH452_04275 [Clostridiales bacterium]|nr:hypothetical protein [Clostridiales bacterium]
MKQFKKYCVGMLLLVTLLFVTACGSSNDGTATDNGGNETTTDGNVDNNGTAGEDVTGNGTDINDVLFDTDDDGVYDHTDIDGDGLLEEIGRDTNDVVDDLVDDVTGTDGTLNDGTLDNGTTENGTVDGTGTVENGKDTTTP